MRLTQDLSDKDTGYGYSYVKTVRLVPGKAQMVIEHVLTNTGKKPHRDLGLLPQFPEPGSPATRISTLTAPFDIKRRQAAGGRCRGGQRQDAEISARGEGRRKRHHARFTGFGSSVSDYDFKVVNTKTGFGQRIRADQPLARINFWSIRTTFSWEPYIAISLKPGETKRWTYTYDYFGPGEG